MNKIGEFLAQLFLARDIAHRAHWLTSVEARHEALGGFYEAITDATDTFAEAWMGEFGQKVPGFNIESDYESSKEVTVALREILSSIRVMRDLVVGGSRPLNNLADEIESEFLAVLYKLEQLY